jgi:hypothetical protein
VAASLLDWRKGLPLCVLAGFLQDPLRKLIPGEPIYLTALAGLFLGTTLLSAMGKGALPKGRAIEEWWRALWAPLTVFFIVLALQSLRTWVQYDSPQLAGLGLMAYFAPLPAALVGYAFARDARRIRQFLTFYAVLSVAAAVGVFLSFLGYDWRVFEQVGEGLKVWNRAGEQMEVYTGFLRSPEVAAWHTATGVCFLVILAARARRIPPRLLAGLLIVLLISAGLLTTRRKTLVVVVLFLAGYWFLLAYLGRGSRRVATVVAVVTIVGALLSADVLEPQDSGPSLDPYVQHGVSAFREAPGRFEIVGLRSLEWAFKVHGIFGAGAGTGSQGSQHFGSAALVTAEGGLGKVLTELGVPGLLAALWVGVVMLRLLWRLMKGLPDHERELVTLSYGLVAFLSANMLMFLVSSQVYGDLFVLFLLGWVLGFIMAVPRMKRVPSARAPEGGMIPEQNRPSIGRLNVREVS